jgi:hypothetical protein
LVIAGPELEPQRTSTMNENAVSPFEIAGKHRVEPSPDGSAIVLKADALQGDSRTALEIAITTEIAPAVAISLLAQTAKARSARDSLEPAMNCMAASATLSDDAQTLRLQLLFDKGAVVPVEMPRAAGEAMYERLKRELGKLDA